MKQILAYTITFCLILIVILMLVRNKREINAEIQFAERKVEAYPVKVEIVKQGMLDTELEVSGILSAVHDLMLMVETQGRVQSIYKKEGDWVKQGDAIAQVNDELMRAELMVTEANYEKAKKDLERALTLNEGGALTQQQLEGLQLNEKAAEAKFITSKKRVEDALIKAPISGYINKMFLKDGGMIGAGVPVCELVNTRSLKMSVKVDETEVVKINRGQEVNVKVSALNGEIIKGAVLSVGAKADYALQYGVELIVNENPNEMLKAGMVVTAIFHFKDKIEGPVIPLKALTGSFKEPQVYVVEGDIARLKPVKIDYAFGNFIKVADGLSTGEELIVSGQFNLRDGIRVKVIE